MPDPGSAVTATSVWVKMSALLLESELSIPSIAAAAFVKLIILPVWFCSRLTRCPNVTTFPRSRSKSASSRLASIRSSAICSLVYSPGSASQFSSASASRCLSLNREGGQTVKRTFRGCFGAVCVLASPVR